MKNIFVFLAVCFFALSIESARAQTGPKYVIRINYDAVNNIIPSEDGSFNWSFSEEQEGIDSSHCTEFYGGEDSVFIDEWVREDLYGTTYSSNVIWSGELSNTAPGAPSSANMFPFTTTQYGYVDGGSRCYSYGGQSCTMPIGFTDYLYGGGNPYPTYMSFDEYPGVGYYKIGGTGYRYYDWNFYGDCRYPPLNVTPWSFDNTDSINVQVTGEITDGSQPPYQKQPGNAEGPKTPMECGDGDTAAGGPNSSGVPSNPTSDVDPSQFSANANVATGNFEFTYTDPVVTRGFPLRNEIHINSQVVERNRAMGSATFTYDMHVFTPAMTGHTNLQVIDGDGQVLDFGNGSTPIAGVGVIYSPKTG